MNINVFKLSLKAMLLQASICLFVIGCSKTVARENILSSLDTAIGLTLAENKQTQMYELKAGYIRSQFYSIPTGKSVEIDKFIFSEMSTCKKISSIPIATLSVEERSKVFSILSSCVNASYQHQSNSANIVPELVSGIRAHSGLQDVLLGMDISENFAVGKEAVNSQAAIAMYISQAATTDNTAMAASNAVLKTFSPSNTQEDAKARNELDSYLTKTLKDGQNCGGITFNHTDKIIDYANCLANSIAPGKTSAYIKYMGGKDLETLNNKLKNSIQ